MSEKYYSKWEFNHDGEGCDTCQDASGIYDTEPDRPHLNCDCEIREVNVDEDNNIIDDVDETEEICDDVVDTTVWTSEMFDTSKSGDYFVKVEGTMSSDDFLEIFEDLLFTSEKVTYSHDSKSFSQLIRADEVSGSSVEVRMTWDVVQHLCMEEKMYDNSGELSQKVVSNEVIISFNSMSID
ncbi:hypothetical protein [Tenacibaculum aestuariivivum]|uniref:hypothetical protein n=1 Tax=Tenacibaculum aestuariivivum TaxID=2006131 RepID=UPI003AB3DD68